ncbi:MFS transporter [Metapseudomonas lalkuanensis]|uniref:MFS transporter n=1 Tax=Metapseudomonas lalkuanensis TaxID=2604832 RepID=UPI001CF39A7B|nr:MFS transporter [Pseudomonas lalkuanensis]UCO96001.1 MFS transporter [Pseudomonas lalkuanensis]
MPAATTTSRIPRTVWALGFVSLFMDLSSELVHGLLPLYLVGSLGASMLAVGLIEGLAEATALVVKVFSGAISDYLGKRKGLLLFGYGLAALTKPLFPLAGSADQVLLARLLDRVGKGIRGAPRDALVADVAPPEIRGACFGLRQAMDTVGAFLGPLLAILLMTLLDDDIRLVLWFAVLPALVSVACILVGVKEPEASRPSRQLRSPVRFRAWRSFPAAYWWVVSLGSLFSLARFSEAFLVLRAQDAGFSTTWVPLVMVVMAGFYMLSAYPAGKLSDRVSPTGLLAFSLVLLIVADLLLARADSPALLLAGVALWGLHMGFSQGILAALVAETTPTDLKGSAFGLFNLASGAALLVASVLAGWLWQSLGAASTFLAGAVFCVATLLLLALRRR